jgi:hypothetical protein
LWLARQVGVSSVKPTPGGEVDIGLVVVAQGGAAMFVVEQLEGDEFGQLDATLEDHRRLQAAIADERRLAPRKDHAPIL